jgi:hypothetical protein
MNRLLADAAQPIDLNGTIGGPGLGKVNENIGAIGSAQDAGNQIAKVLSGVVGFLTVAGAIWFLFQILTAGLGWISAGGDKNKLTEARERLTNAFIGLTVVVAAWAILALAGVFFGISFTDPGAILNTIQLNK